MASPVTYFIDTDRNFAKKLSNFLCPDKTIPIPSSWALPRRNPSTTIEFDLLKASKVTLKIFNILGEEVATLVSEKLAAGKYEYEWDASREGGMASGVYLYRLQVGTFIQTKKLILLE